MADPFVAEIRMFPFNFAPKGWAFCDGQQLPLSQNTALFSLLGTTYGGDGKVNFALPDLQGSSPMHPGQGQNPTLSQRTLGEVGGTQSVLLIQSELPAHSHALQLSEQDGISNSPEGQLPAGAPGMSMYTDLPGTPVMMAVQASGPSGGNLPHNNLMPYLTLNFCIALQGVFPPRG
jgi:microcystin-dependent protein